MLTGAGNLPNDAVALLSGTVNFPPVVLASLPLSGLRMVRGDLIHPHVSGNKWYKLYATVQAVRQTAKPSYVFSFGGQWSNHLHALAAAGREFNFQVVGFVRGSPAQSLTLTLQDALAWGMQLAFVTRSDYRCRHDSAWRHAQATHWLASHGIDPVGATIRVLPEGGSDAQALPGLQLWAQQIRAAAGSMDTLIVPVGSGATLAGLRLGLSPECRVVGIPVVRDVKGITERINALLAGQATGPWELWEGYEGAGFGKLSAQMEKDILDLEAQWQVPLDPVYTGKLALAVLQRRKSGQLPGRDIVLLHTGGLQGRRGFNWPREREIIPAIRYPVPI
jgi:1-aminocyclopropane-1-carboxylate deaminase